MMPATANATYVNGVDTFFGDNVHAAFGVDGAGNARSHIVWDGTNLVIDVSSDATSAAAFNLVGGALLVGGGTDVDVDLVTVNVTGSPTVSWDESEDSFVLDKGLRFTAGQILADDSTSTALPPYSFDGDPDTGIAHPAANTLAGVAGGAERWRTTSSGTLLIGKTVSSFTTSGVENEPFGLGRFTRDGAFVMQVNRLSTDGDLIRLYQDGSEEGSISVSGTTVSYNGAHLSRWSQWADDPTARPAILRGTILSNRDEMCEWKQLRYQWTNAEGVAVSEVVQHDGAAASGESIQYMHDPGGENEQTVTATVHDEENEQLNRTVVSDVAGDRDVAGVFQGYDEDDDTTPYDFYCAQTGDFVIRVGSGVTVQRGDLLESAGDGTARPQSDDIVRARTVAKVTSTTVSETYADGSYCVPCVLMVC